MLVKFGIQVETLLDFYILFMLDFEYFTFDVHLKYFSFQKGKKNSLKSIRKISSNKNKIQRLRILLLIEFFFKKVWYKLACMRVFISARIESLIYSKYNLRRTNNLVDLSVLIVLILLTAPPRRRHYGLQARTNIRTWRSPLYSVQCTPTHP